MDIIYNEHRHDVIMGNLTVDLLKFGSHPETDKYLESIYPHGFLPVITKSTRVTPSSATLIDYTYTNRISSHTYAGVIVTENINLTCTHKCNYRQIRYYSEATISSFKNYLKEADVFIIF